MGSPYVVRDTLVPVVIHIDIANPDAPRVLADWEVAKLDQANLPTHVKKETSHWRRPNWFLATVINSNSYTENRRGEQEFSLTKFAQARIRCLLVDWSLKESDATLAMEKVAPDELPNVQLLTDKTMTMIGTINDEIMNAFYREAMRVLYPAATVEEKEEKEAPKN